MKSPQFYLCFPLAICSAIFVAIVTSLSAVDSQLFQEPLSNYRYGQYALWGRLSFFLLIVIGLLYVAISFHVADSTVQFVAILSCLLIMVVSVTPTVHAGHEIAANGLMVLLYGFILCRLYLASSIWVFAHVFAPLVILSTIMSASYLNFGIIQKSFILYLVLVVNIDGLVLVGIPIIPWDFHAMKDRQRKQVKIPSPRVMYRKSRWDRLLEGSRT